MSPNSVIGLFDRLLLGRSLHHRKTWIFGSCRIAASEHLVETLPLLPTLRTTRQRYSCCRRLLQEANFSSQSSVKMSSHPFPTRDEIRRLFSGVEEGDLSTFLQAIAHDVDWTMMGTVLPIPCAEI